MTSARLARRLPARRSLESDDRSPAARSLVDRIRSGFALPLFACGLALLCGEQHAWAQGSGSPNVPPKVVFQFQYAGKAPGHPTYAETIANVIYPVGKGPVDQGYPVEPLPVLVMIRGGNSNKFGVGELDIDTMAAQAPSIGAIGVSTNMPILGSGDDYDLSAAGIKRVIQHLRDNAPNLKIDPDRVIRVGRSVGLVYYAPRFGPTALHCFSTGVGSWEQSLSILFFPGQAFQDVSSQLKWDDSPIHWLLTPERYGRTYTPPLCIASQDSSSQPCGQVNDVHSGIFGRISLQAMRDYARATDDWEWFERRGFVDISVTPAEVGIVQWSLERLAEDFDGLYGAPLTVNCVGGVPGSSVSLFTGAAPASYPISGCPDLEGLIDNAALVGTSTVAGDGLVTWQFPADPGLLGQTVLFRAVDLTQCEASNLVVHRYF